MASPAPPVREPDAREEAEWFQRLPPHAQEEMRERWRLQAGRTEQLAQRRRGAEVRYVIEGWMLFAFLEMLFFGLSVNRLLLLAVPGVALGWVAHRIRADLWRYMVVAVALYFAVYGLLGLIALGHFIVFTCAAAAIGFTHEMLRADGTEG